MIPKNIGRADVLEAIKQIESEGVPEGRSSVKWSVSWEGELYPPKYLISLSNVFANGHELPPSEHSGGVETNTYLEALGFDIVDVGSHLSELPYSSHSWVVLSPSVVTKAMDRSSFVHGGSAIPKLIRSFFSIDVKEMVGDEAVELYYRGRLFKAKITLVNNRTKLYWASDLASEIKNRFPDCYDDFDNDEKPSSLPTMRFCKDLSNHRMYEVQFVRRSEINDDLASEQHEEEPVKTKEGAVKECYGKRYERNPLNRERAIEIHGTKCTICGFDFEAAYGERGRGFIEVHHVKPLYHFK